MAQKVKLTDLVLRDAHQSLHATRMTTADMLPVCDKLDKIGYFSLEAWGGATFDSCIRFLNEDPWERLRKLHAKLPNTPIMMLLRGQNLLGYRHYADDVVDAFVAAAAKNGVGIFRIFDACNDPRNLKRAADAAKKTGKHVQMAISYATTPYHTKEVYADLAKSYADFGADSICIKDMSGLLKPYEAYDLVKAIKAKVDIPIEIHSHATTGMSVASLTKAAEAGAEILDTTISSMSMGTSHSPTETMVEIFKGTAMDTGLEIKPLLEIAAYFREIRKKYAKFESSFLGADTRILASQVPGGMLSNMENQLKEQGAADKIDEVLKEIQIVQKDCGYIPLVTPTSQIVGTQSVFNVLFGRYAKLTQETRDLLTGKYGATPAKPNPELVKEALKQNNMEEPVTCRPADLIPNELDKMAAEAKENGGDGSIEDTLTYAMFPKVAPKFFKERANGPVSSDSFALPKASSGSASGGNYTVSVNGAAYNVVSGPAGDTMNITVNGTAYNVAFACASASAQGASSSSASAVELKAPVAGTLLKQTVADGTNVSEGQTVIMVESMKMELEVKATASGPIHFKTAAGSAITAGQVLAVIGNASVSPVQAPAAAVQAPAAAQAPSGGAVVNAPVAGTYLKNTVAEGSAVTAGQTIVMIESMKMELEVKAASNGTVHFLVSPGAAITAGQPLAEIK
ncbi:sodium-extruding oxaloacetate decarboxylase subunit alpha [Treponema lecithinolyticum]|uniref:Oxaloacetate decarboxylase alpha subunit n=2 Tax=Treponema lecithinolyticum TaxID=53418 RepID=A0ABN0P0W7_TRELE|nr:sodium-extruding oxaloacetate decarboxylase subunit alpha [Treponema lecithinolyticum]ERJ94128.1 oxaloacetate decarboxylase alpha subunit [Treponema lecithinolyticum ATCC 700332]